MRIIVCLAVVAWAGSGMAQQPIVGTVFASGLSAPVQVIQDPLHTDTQYVLQKGGQIRTLINGVPSANALDISGSISTTAERGLLGMVFNPNNANQAFLYYNGPDGAIHVSHWDRSGVGARTFDGTTRVGVIHIDHSEFGNHNGGTIAFGPDNLLYLGTGDGGGGNDPHGNAQNPNVLLGKILRIDPFGPDGQPGDPENNYAIPADNPFVGSNGPISARGEIFHFGVRNPFRWTFDFDGSMWIGDVGQGPNPPAHEEIDYVGPGVKGLNFGWNQWEGTLQHPGGAPLAYNPMTPPIYEYVLGPSASAIIGGLRYRSTRLGSFYYGRYFFADEVSRKVWSFRVTDTPGGVTLTDLRDHTNQIFGSIGPGAIVSFNTGADGALYLTDVNGRIIRVDLPRPVSIHPVGAR